jgi:hypothetical protein
MDGNRGTEGGDHSVTRAAHEWIAPALTPGGVAVDATAGNGLDTVFLARTLGPRGRVHAFDVQCRALLRAARRSAGAEGLAEVRWHRANHARMCRHLRGARAVAVMFNLGWLPRGDRARITRPESTLAALDAAAACLAPGGRLSVVAYRGHPGGAEEDAAVSRWMRTAPHGLLVEPPWPGDPPPQAPVLYRASAPAYYG